MGVELALVANVLGLPADGHPDIRVTDVTHDSRAAGPGTVFVAIPGERHDGHDFVGAAEQAGCAAIVAERPVGSARPVFVVPDTRAAMAMVAREVHGRPDEGLSILGITGTNGKTTVVHMCEAVWSAIGRSYGIVGTLGARFDGTPVPLGHTTPESSDLQRLLGRMRDAGTASVAMEVSSHALALHRADAIEFTAVGFTNLTQDHLDFHGSMEAYLEAKLLLFQSHRAPVAVVNTTTVDGRVVAARSEQDVVTVGIGVDADITARGITAHPDGTSFELTTREGSIPTSLPLVGTFNVENALVAAGLLIQDGVDLEGIARGLPATRPIPGRMEVIRHPGDFMVIVDYAHTPDAIRTVLAAARHRATGRVVAIVGAGGDRDRSKRRPMGEAAASGADVTIVTTDNPRHEDPVEIARRVQEGALSEGSSDVRMILDRAEAISEAVRSARSGDVIMILGKGHEQGQQIGDTVLPFDDREAARRALGVAPEASA